MEFDVKEAVKRGVFISGARGCGKSNLAKIVVQRLLNEGYTVKIFDNSQAWRGFPVQNVMVKPDRRGRINMNVDLFKNYVFDISLMYTKDQRRFAEGIVDAEFNIVANMPKALRPTIIYILEESEILMPTRNHSEPLLRLICVGRNYNMSYVAICQRLATVSTTLISLSGQAYFGLAWEQNDMSKLANWLKHRVREVETLKTGEFMYMKGRYIKRIQTPLFESMKVQSFVA